MIRVGIIGIGFMGWVHWLSYERLRGVRVAAICTRDRRKLAGDWRGIQGNFGPPGERVQLGQTATYGDIDDLLADERIELVDICLPPAMHADVTVRALAAGKHVLCEKPMALKLGDCRRMTAAAKQAERQLLIGHVLPFFPEYDWALKVARSGKYGKVLGGTFRRVIADPKWLKNYWLADEVGGPLLDLHVHDAHFMRLLFGLPETVTAEGRMRAGLAQYWHSQFRFKDGDLIVITTSGTIDQQGRPFLHGFEIQFERAMLQFEFAVIGGDGRYLCAPTLLNNKGRVESPKLSDGNPMNAFPRELAEAVRAIRLGRPSEILGAQLAQDAIRICEAQAVSLKGRRIVPI